MNITRETIGRILGIGILSTFVLSLAYLMASFIVWDWNPNNWGSTARLLTVAGVFLELAIYALITKVNVVSDEERR